MESGSRYGAACRFGGDMDRAMVARCGAMVRVIGPRAVAAAAGIGERLTGRGLSWHIVDSGELPATTLLVQSLRCFDLVMLCDPPASPAATAARGCPVVFSGDGVPLIGEDEIDIDELVGWLDRRVVENEVWGCVLIGGKSSRMGRPKHLIADDSGLTWLERSVGLLAPVTSGVVVAGSGELPAALATMNRLVDVPGAVGPLGGMLAAFRWQPFVSWLMVACDMPMISGPALGWLLAQRKSGVWGVTPRRAGSSRAEPLFAWYDCRAAQIFEDRFLRGERRVSLPLGSDHISLPEIPGELAASWSNVNTPAELPRPE